MERDTTPSRSANQRSFFFFERRTMNRLWRELAYPHISQAEHDRIYKKIAKGQLYDWIDEHHPVWENGGWNEVGAVIQDFIRTQEVYINIAKQHGDERYYIIAKKVAMDELYFVNLKDGGK